MQQTDVTRRLNFLIHDLASGVLLKTNLWLLAIFWLEHIIGQAGLLLKETNAHVFWNFFLFYNIIQTQWKLVRHSDGVSLVICYNYFTITDLISVKFKVFCVWLYQLRSAVGLPSIHAMSRKAEKTERMRINHHDHKKEVIPLIEKYDVVIPR